jgi:phosphatidylglycerophosphatase A
MTTKQTTNRANWQQKKTLWAWIVGTVCGAGLLRPGPGTYGSIAAMLWWMAGARALSPADLSGHYNAAHQTFFFGLRLGLPSYTALAAIVATLIGIPAATIVARESNRKDPGHVVIDEVAGQLIALIGIKPDWPHALLSLALFRLFDIVKPPPCRWLERLPEGTGIMLDDVAAGVYALVIAHLIGLWF